MWKDSTKADKAAELMQMVPHALLKQGIIGRNYSRKRKTPTNLQKYRAGFTKAIKQTARIITKSTSSK